MTSGPSRTYKIISRIVFASVLIVPVVSGCADSTDTGPHSIANFATEPEDKSDADWDVVPVYYGTDRNVETDPMGPKDAKRLKYGSGRGKRLEVGGALVTVPKSHQMPNIERPWFFKLPFTNIVILSEAEDQTKHFTLKALRKLSPEELMMLVKARLDESERFEDQALVFVHGFGTTFDYALYRTAQLAYDLEFDGATFLYSWPSRGELGLTAYAYDRASSDQAVPYLKQFLELVARKSGAKSINIIAHSMGNNVLMNVLREFNRTSPGGVRVSQVILAAPDIDRDDFENLARDIRGVSKGITLYAASNDYALEASRQFWGGVPRAGDVPKTGPVVVPGIDTIDVTATSTEIFSLNHSGFAQKSALLNDISLLFKSGQRPSDPDKRMPILRRIQSPHGDFWRIPG